MTMRHLSTSMAALGLTVLLGACTGQQTRSLPAGALVCDAASTMSVDCTGNCRSASVSTTDCTSE